MIKKRLFFCRFSSLCVPLPRQLNVGCAVAQLAYILAAHSHRTLRPRSPHTSVAKARNLPTGPEGARAGRCEERAAAETAAETAVEAGRAPRPEGQKARAQGGRGKETRTQQTGTEAGAPLASWAALDSLLNLDTRGCP